MLLIDILEEIKLNVKLEEDIEVIQNILFLIYINDGISNKDIAKVVLLPIPVVSAIKNELKKLKFVKQQAGIKLTDKGLDFVENTLKYKNFNKELYYKLVDDNSNIEILLKDEILLLEEILNNRPEVDVLIDQSKCTVLTSINRAILALRNGAIIGKNILCMGDDDFVSVSISIIAKKLFSNEEQFNCDVTVLDIDKRILEYIESVSKEFSLPISILHYDAKNPLPAICTNQFDCLFTDPPYTIQGLDLFLSRGLAGLKKQSCLKIFFSFANKSPDVTLQMQKSFNDMGLIVKSIDTTFNEYEGAKILGSTGQMIILNTTRNSTPKIINDYTESLYTGELKMTTRTYKCKNCKKLFKIGFDKNFKTIEELKKSGCEYCNENKFDLVKKSN